MLDVFQILEVSCDTLQPIISVLKHGFMPIIQIGIPIILIVLGSIDLGKAVIASDDKEVKAAQSRLIKRCIYAVAIFFVVTIVQLLTSLLANMQNNETGNIDADSWWGCWKEA